MQFSKETRTFIKQHRTDDVRKLALSKAPADVDLPAALSQIAGWQAALHKLPVISAFDNFIYPPLISIEQCSSESTAIYKAGVIGRHLKGWRKNFVDLTGGLGIDCVFFSMEFKHLTYVERNEVLCRIAQHNFRAIQHSKCGVIKVVNDDAAHFLNGLPDRSVDLIYLDPSRRSSDGGRVTALSDCEPNLVELLPQLLRKGRHLMVKLSPMLDLTVALQAMPTAQEVHIVAVGGECKELLIMAGQEEQAADDVPITCFDLPKSKFRFTRREEAETPGVYANALGNYLYEPNAAVMKGGAFRRISYMYKVAQLHPNSHLYTSEKLVGDFPGRIFRIVGSSGWSKAELKELLGSLKQANIAVRNFPATVVELRQRLKLGDGGKTYLFATTLADGRRVLIKTLKI
jgi:hypothetical protein